MPETETAAGATVVVVPPTIVPSEPETPPVADLLPVAIAAGAATEAARSLGEDVGAIQARMDQMQERMAALEARPIALPVVVAPEPEPEDVTAIDVPPAPEPETPPSPAPEPERSFLQKLIFGPA